MVSESWTATLSSDGTILFDALGHDLLLTSVVVVFGYVGLLATSGYVVRASFEYANVTTTEEGQEDTGRAIGKIENILVLSLMIAEAYTALGVIFAAKAIVRQSDMSSGDTSYYLTGTIANFTYSIVVGLLVHVLLWAMIM